MKKTLLPILCVLSLMGCNDNQTGTAGKSYRTPADLKLESDVMTPEVLWAFGRIGNVQVLADGQSTQITNTAGNEAEPNWTPDGKHISYLADGQLWEMNPDGTSPRQVTNIEGGINGYVYAPDMSKIVYLKDVKLEPTVQDLHPDLPKAQARIINDQFYRHWNDWVEGYTHLFIADYTAGQAITAGKDIMEGERGVDEGREAAHLHVPQESGHRVCAVDEYRPLCLPHGDGQDCQPDGRHDGI